MKRMWLIATVSLLLFGLCSNSAQAQFYVEPKAGVAIEYYPMESRDFQAQSRAQGRIEAGYLLSDQSRIDLQLGISVTRHLKNESQIDGSPLQTEATKVLQFEREAILSFVHVLNWGRVQAGGWVGRRSIHWLDRDCQCYFNDFPDNFPEDDISARAALEEIRKDRIQPGLAYHDGVRPYLKLRFDRHDFAVEVLGPAYRWHGITLPYNSWKFNMQYSYGNVTVGNKSEFGGLMEYSSDTYAYYSLIPEVAFGVHFGRIPYPGYGKPLDRVAIGLDISLSKLHRW